MLLMSAAHAQQDVQQAKQYLKDHFYQPTEKRFDTTEHVATQIPTDTQTQSVVLELGEGLVFEINKAILTKDWKNLPQLLQAYRLDPNYDKILHDYALGTWHYSQKNHKEAIKLYQNIITQGQFAYLSFDLGIMLFENKQYQEAKTQLLIAKPQLDKTMKNLAEQYLAQIEKKQRPKVHFTANYEQTNNVNNASSATTIEWQGKTWTKSQESLPQKAHGVRYDTGVSWYKNMTGQHFISSQFGISGVHYWDNQEYNEQLASTTVGYQYQDTYKTLSFMPFYEYMWLDGESYQYEQGANVGLSQYVSPRFRLSADVRYADRNYHHDRLALNYDSQVWSAATAAQYALKPNLWVFGGVNVSDDDTKNPEYASLRKGMTLGMIKQMDNGLATRLSVRYAKREFKAPEKLLYHFIRQDHEYYVNAAFWYDKWHYKNFMPQFNVHYHKIDSNMKDLYSRDGTQYFISIEKRF